MITTRLRPRQIILPRHPRFRRGDGHDRDRRTGEEFCSRPRPFPDTDWKRCRSLRSDHIDDAAQMRAAIVGKVSDAMIAVEPNVLVRL